MGEQVAAGVFAPVAGRDAGQDMWVPEGAQGYTGLGVGLEAEGEAGGLGEDEGGGYDEPMAPGQRTPQQAKEEGMYDAWDAAEAESLEEVEEAEEDEEEELHRAAEGEAGRGGGGGGKGKEARLRELGDGRGKVNATIKK